MSTDRVRIDIDEHGIAEVVMIRADKMNALDQAMFDALAGAIARLKTERGLRAVVLHGEGRAFCAGLDKGRFGKIASGADGGTRDLRARTHGIANSAQILGIGWRELPVPVVAAVQGAAFGGGLQLALGADLRYITAETQLCVMEIKWGLVPDMAGCVLMSELVRPDIVRELTFSGRIVGGAEAVAIGLATRVDSDPLAAARDMARQIAGRNPDAIRAGKRLLNAASPVNAAPVLMAESLEQQRLIGSPNQVEAVRAALEQRAPVFR